MLRQYGITEEEYQRLLAEQGGVCAICRQEQREKRSHPLVVDHSHEDGAVRGLLCHPCNRAIGGLKDQPLLLSRATTYLLEHPRENK